MPYRLRPFVALLEIGSALKRFLLTGCYRSDGPHDAVNFGQLVLADYS